MVRSSQIRVKMIAELVIDCQVVEIWFAQSYCFRLNVSILQEYIADRYEQQLR